MNKETFMNKETQESSQLSAEILGEYPDLQNLSKEEKLAVSATYLNIRTVERNLEKVQTGKPTVDIEYHLSDVGKTLDRLKSENNPVLEKFIADHKAKLEDVTARAKEIIGNKKRGDMEIYR